MLDSISPKVGQERVSGGVSFLCWHATSVANAKCKPQNFYRLIHLYIITMILHLKFNNGIVSALPCYYWMTLIVIRDSFSPWTSARFQTDGAWPNLANVFTYFYVPRSNDRGHIVLTLSVCLSVSCQL